MRFGEGQIDFRQGDLRQSEGDLDLAIQGSGFLVLLDGDKTYYARTGQFVVDKDGYISQQGTENHLAVLDEAGKAVALNIDDKRTSAPVATTKVSFADNLSSTATTATVSDVAVYDSLGGKQTWQVKFNAVVDSSPREWTVAACSLILPKPVARRARRHIETAPTSRQLLPPAMAATTRVRL